MPPQPDGVWQVVYSDDRWVTSQGDDRYRRGIYTFWRRTSPYPSAMALDATSRETCTIRRITTNTPIAAFALLNDPVYVEAAQALARRIMEHADQRLEFASNVCVSTCIGSAAQRERNSSVGYAIRFRANVLRKKPRCGRGNGDGRPAKQQSRPTSHRWPLGRWSATCY